MNLLNKILFVLLLAPFVFPVTIVAQAEHSINQLKDKLKQFEKRPGYLTDSGYASTLIDLAYLYTSSYPDSAILLLEGNAERCKATGYKRGEVNTYMFLADAYATKGMYDVSMENYDKCLQLAKKINYEYAIPLILNRIGIIDLDRGNYPEALRQFYESLKSAESIGDDDLVGATLNNIANVQFYQNKFSEAESTFTQQLKVAQKNADTSGMSSAYNSIGEVNLQRKNPAKALYNLNNAYNLASAVSDLKMLMVSTLSLAEVYYEMDSLQRADSIFKYALQLSEQIDDGTSVCNALTGLAKTQLKRGLLSEALANALGALQKAKSMGQVQLIRDASETLSAIYEALHDGINALIYYKLYKVYDDSMNNMAGQRAVAIEKASYDFSKKEGEFQRKTLQQQWLLFSAFTGVVLLAVILWIIIRNRNRLKHTHKELQHKNALIENQKIIAEETLIKLQATQRQLIQSEKMASLGQLTAGIAHEIQNPLNFVNNFSEINTELIDELKEEADKGNIDEVKAIANNIAGNEQKITHHGKRADSIVKGMLQHSRASTGKKELTDINTLVDECVRLSYHGLRARDKEFNVVIKTELDKTIDKIDVVPQDISGVLINLLNNAFYAVKEALALKGADYVPTILVITKHTCSPPADGAGCIELHVRDNGIGIPQNIIDKIFQPFFTTKPTGQGTGLGLSLSYDIIKAHGGEVQVNSIEGEGSEFIVALPLS